MDTRTKKIRVAVFTDTFDEINGVSNTYHRLLDWAAANGKRLDVYCFGETDGIERIRTCRVIRFKRIVAVRYYETLAFELTPHLPLIAALQNARHDIVHVAAPDTMGLHALAYARWKSRPLVGVYHTCIPEYAAHLVREPLIGSVVQQTVWHVVRSFYENCALVYATTPAMQQQLVQNGLGVPMDVLSRGIDSVLFHPSKRTVPKTVNGEIPTLLYVGRLSHEKNLEWMAQQLSEARNSGLHFHVRIVGDGPMRSALESLMPWAEFTGFLQGEALARTYANADIFVFPSLTDTFGNVVREAMASGLPALVCDEKGPGEIVTQGQDGFIAPCDEAFQGHLRDLVCSPELREQMGQSARRSAEGKDWESVFGKLWHQYEEMACLTR